MTNDEARAFGVPEERLKEFQETYHRDMRKVVQRQAENGAAKPIRAAISSMLPLIQDMVDLREILTFVTEIYCRPGWGKPAERV